MTAVDDEVNNDNNSQQIEIDNGELFSFAEGSAQNEGLEEVNKTWRYLFDKLYEHVFRVLHFRFKTIFF